MSDASPLRLGFAVDDCIPIQGISLVLSSSELRWLGSREGAGAMHDIRLRYGEQMVELIRSADPTKELVLPL